MYLGLRRRYPNLPTGVPPGKTTSLNPSAGQSNVRFVVPSFVSDTVSRDRYLGETGEGVLCHAKQVARNKNYEADGRHEFTLGVLSGEDGRNSLSLFDEIRFK